MTSRSLRPLFHNDKLQCFSRRVRRPRCDACSHCLYGLWRTRIARPHIDRRSRGARACRDRTLCAWSFAKALWRVWAGLAIEHPLAYWEKRVAASLIRLDLPVASPLPMSVAVSIMIASRLIAGYLPALRAMRLTPWSLESRIASDRGRTRLGILGKHLGYSVTFWPSCRVDGQPFRYVTIVSKLESGVDDENGFVRINGAVERDPAIDVWMKERAGDWEPPAHQVVVR